MPLLVKNRCPVSPAADKAAAALWRVLDAVALRGCDRVVLVAHQLPVANNYPPSRRTLRAITPFHTRLNAGRKELVLSEKPAALRHLGSLNKKVLKQYQTHLKRERTSLEEAEFYVREKEYRALKSLAALARLLGLPRKRVTRHVQLLGLPEPIKRFLTEHRTPEYVRYFSEGRLHELVRLDARSAWRQFQAMVREAQQEAGIWRSPAQ